MALPVRRRHEGPERTGLDAFGELERLNRQLSSYLDSWRHLPDALSDAFTPLADVEETSEACTVEIELPGMLSDAFTPLADVEETSEAYTVEIELPGIKKDDLDISIAGRRLIVAGERKERPRLGVLRRRERVVGRFHYEVTLPGDVDEDVVEANLDEGVLTVRVPKPERDRPGRIEVR